MVTGTRAREAGDGQSSVGQVRTTNLMKLDMGLALAGSTTRQLLVPSLENLC